MRIMRPVEGLRFFCTHLHYKRSAITLTVSVVLFVVYGLTGSVYAEDCQLVLNNNSSYSAEQVKTQLEDVFERYADVTLSADPQVCRYQVNVTGNNKIVQVFMQNNGRTVLGKADMGNPSALKTAATDALYRWVNADGQARICQDYMPESCQQAVAPATSPLTENQPYGDNTQSQENTAGSAGAHATIGLGLSFLSFITSDELRNAPLKKDADNPDRIMSSSGVSLEMGYFFTNQLGIGFRYIYANSKKTYSNIPTGLTGTNEKMNIDQTIVSAGYTSYETSFASEKTEDPFKNRRLTSSGTTWLYGFYMDLGEHSGVGLRLAYSYLDASLNKVEGDITNLSAVQDKNKYRPNVDAHSLTLGIRNNF
ncbi:hypothetical protein CHS0354_035370 [Potamilus streckersoni]|uniref:Uncharacterized protein n=1 Tax=Potamilus streckersoni TaxID=2493646 RepID=A0AAE0S328_9BIVA|nr:hypothetical protein CHS0354_035370 [Potamilus streckersoni]